MRDSHMLTTPTSSVGPEARMPASLQMIFPFKTLEPSCKSFLLSFNRQRSSLLLIPFLNFHLFIIFLLPTFFGSFSAPLPPLPTPHSCSKPSSFLDLFISYFFSPLFSLLAPISPFPLFSVSVSCRRFLAPPPHLVSAYTSSFTPSSSSLSNPQVPLSPGQFGPQVRYLITSAAT